MLTINKIWEMACSGEAEKLENLILENVVNPNAHYNGMSLLIGAYRNRELDTVEMLIAYGGKVEPREAEEIEPYITKKRLEIAEKMIALLIGGTLAEESADSVKGEALKQLTEKLNEYKKVIE